MTDSVLLSRAESALRLSVSVQTVSKWIKEGRLVAVPLGVRRIGVTVASVKAIIEGGAK